MKSLQSVPAIKGDVPGRRGPRARLARAVRRVSTAKTVTTSAQRKAQILGSQPLLGRGTGWCR